MPWNSKGCGLSTDIAVGCRLHGGFGGLGTNFDCSSRLRVVREPEVPTQEQIDAYPLDDGDTSWLITASAMVLLMTPGLAFFYGGMASGCFQLVQWCLFMVAWFVLGVDILTCIYVGGRAGRLGYVIFRLDWLGPPLFHKLAPLVLLPFSHMLHPPSFCFRFQLCIVELYEFSCPI